jgi:hypothetical protein
LSTIQARVTAAGKAFRKPQIIVDITDPNEFDEYDSRLNRQQIEWAMYENTAYDSIHLWATEYKKKFGLYKYIRNIFNPTTRIGNFYQAHIWPGALDRDAGDGTKIVSALPIITDNEVIRPAIANVWQWSNWSIKKNLVPLKGSTMGDGYIQVIDDPFHQKVYFKVIDPILVRDIIKDPFGNIKAYILQGVRSDPHKPSLDVIYTETCHRGEAPDEVIFTTFKDGKEFAWNGIASQWSEFWGFCPLVQIQHNDVGMKFGWSEMHPFFSRIHTVDDTASMTIDQVRKMVQGSWLFSGTSKPLLVPTADAATPSRDRPAPGRETSPAYYVGEKGDAKSLVADIDLSAIAELIAMLNSDLKKNLPELRIDEQEIQGVPSGKALHLLQEPARAKTKMRRVAYDRGAVAAMQMALTIGARNEYPGFETLPKDGFATGEFNHQIGESEVFAQSQIAKLEEADLFWDAVNKAILAGVSLESILSELGWSDEKIRTARQQNARRLNIEQRRAAAVARAAGEEEAAISITEEVIINE